MKPPRLDAPRVAVLLFFLAVLFSLPVLKPAGRELDYAANLTRFLTRFWPPDFSILPTIFPALVETFQIAVLGTVLACLAGIPIAAAASKNIAPRWLVAVVRLLLNAIRSIPGLIWALIAVAILGANAGAGVAALAIYS
ncbi:MAG: phosphonate transporter, permease protein PhnE, partial [Verrucomicrobiota bacterium]